MISSIDVAVIMSAERLIPEEVVLNIHLLFELHCDTRVLEARVLE